MVFWRKETVDRKLAVIAVGGNALIREKGKESLTDQYAAACAAMAQIASIIQAGWDVIVTHGNGPQVGIILRRSELTEHELFTIPLDHCGANTQGSIGYMFQLALINEFRRREMPNHAATVVTETLVDKHDPAFENPTKPIGSFMDVRAAKVRHDADGWVISEDSGGRGWRRVVASPAPIRIVQQDVILTLVKAGFTVIGVGGGGIPVVENEKGELVGVEAVIDKDRASALLARGTSADLLLISTDVEKVALDYNRPNVRWLDRMTVEEAKAYMAQGHFGKGSMQPKIEAALDFLEHGGQRAIITDTGNMLRALIELTGTQILP
ncbi:MAG: carbamate kinase [Anaerolineales bacterium]|nr:carbamate kinase [Anaerolineales bacterium]